MPWAFPRFARSIQNQEDSISFQEVNLTLLIHIHHPPIGKYPSVAPQTNSLGSLYILKSIYGTWMYLQVLRMCWSHQCPSKQFLFSKTSWRRLEDVFSVTLFVFQDLLMTSSRRICNASSSRRLQYFFTKTNVCWGNSWTVKE